MPIQLASELGPAFGRNLSFIRVHQDGMAESVGATAVTVRSNIHFAQGHFVPHTKSGRQLVAHEVAHVFQQLSGRVTVPKGPGLPINADRTLESEAERAGNRAAAGIPVHVEGSRPLRWPSRAAGQRTA